MSAGNVFPMFREPFLNSL